MKRIILLWGLLLSGFSAVAQPTYNRQNQM